MTLARHAGASYASDEWNSTDDENGAAEPRQNVAHRGSGG
jgi:hypothetical protein